MSAHDFVLTVRLAAPAPRVWEAVGTRDGIAGWWTRDVRWDGHEGTVAGMYFESAGFHACFRVVRLDAPRRVEWQCTDSVHPEKSGWSDLREWEGTTVRFDVAPDGDDASVLTFTHEGLVPKLECNDSCRSIWSFYLTQSLRGLVERGQGEPHGT